MKRNRLQEFLDSRKAIVNADGQWDVETVEGVRDLFRTYSTETDNFTVLDVPKSQWHSISRECRESSALNAILMLVRMSNLHESQAFPSLYKLPESELRPLSLERRARMVLINRAHEDSVTLSRAQIAVWVPDPEVVVRILSAGQIVGEYSGTNRDSANWIHRFLCELGLSADQYVRCHLGRYAEWENEVCSAVSRMLATVVNTGSFSASAALHLLATDGVVSFPGAKDILLKECPEEFLLAKTRALFTSPSSEDIDDLTCQTLVECLHIAGDDLVSKMLSGDWRYGNVASNVGCFWLLGKTSHLRQEVLAFKNCSHLAFEIGKCAFSPRLVNEVLKASAQSAKNGPEDRQVNAELVRRAEIMADWVRDFYADKKVEVDADGFRALQTLGRSSHWAPVVGALIEFLPPEKRRKMLRGQTAQMSF